jgi:hypothetical protein
MLLSLFYYKLTCHYFSYTCWVATINLLTFAIMLLRRWRVRWRLLLVVRASPLCLPSLLSAAPSWACHPSKPWWAQPLCRWYSHTFFPAVSQAQLPPLEPTQRYTAFALSCLGWAWRHCRPKSQAAIAPWPPNHLHSPTADQHRVIFWSELSAVAVPQALPRRTSAVPQAAGEDPSFSLSRRTALTYFFATAC